MNYDTLPTGYSLLRRVDLKDKKLAIGLNLAGLPVLAALLVPMGFVVPLHTQVPFRLEMASLSELGLAMLYLLVFSAGTIGYIFLHEWIHGLSFRFLAKAKPRYGFTGLFAYAACETKYICKRHYYVISLAPLAVISLLMLALCLLVPRSWFWIPWWALAANAAGAVGDVYITWLISRLPADCLMIDQGVVMEIYSKGGTA